MLLSPIGRRKEDSWRNIAITLKPSTLDSMRYLVPLSQPYRVFVVVDRNYGRHLTALAETGPVWIADTPVNRSVAEEIWAAYPNRSHLEGVTTFKVPEGTSSEDMLINELDTINLHHGTHSANPPYTVLEVIGAAITARLKAELGDTVLTIFKRQHRDSVLCAPFLMTRPHNCCKIVIALIIISPSRIPTRGMRRE